MLFLSTTILLLLWTILKTASTNATIDLISLGRVNCPTILRHVLSPLSERIDLSCRPEWIRIPLSLLFWFLLSCRLLRVLLRRTAETAEVEVELVLKVTYALRVLLLVLLGLKRVTK